MELEELNDLLEQHAAYSSLAAVMDNNPSEMVELFETGSVTLEILNRRFILSLQIQEE